MIWFRSIGTDSAVREREDSISNMIDVEALMQPLQRVPSETEEKLNGQAVNQLQEQLSRNRVFTLFV